MSKPKIVVSRQTRKSRFPNKKTFFPPKQENYVFLSKQEVPFFRQNEK